MKTVAVERKEIDRQASTDEDPAKKETFEK